MPKYRVNVTQIETWVKQYEIIADDEDRARQLVPILLQTQGEDFLKSFGEERVGELQFGDPDTFAVMDAGPLEEMERAQTEHLRRAKKNIQERFASAYYPEEIEMQIPSKYENVGGEVREIK